MINALDTATQGLLQAERRATDIAHDILKGLSGTANFSSELEATSSASPSDAASITRPTGPSATVVSSPTTVSGPGFSDLIQQMADLRATELAYKANAAVFKRVDETLGNPLGSVFEDKG